jgi:exoribonuclease R
VPKRVVHLAPAALVVDGAKLKAGIEQIQHELGVTPGFPPEVDAAAKQAAASPRMPDLDRTDLPFVTIDPPTSMDLDQAMHLERDRDGYVVHYAIADVAAFVTSGDPVDQEASRRGETLYGADSKIPLHPKVLSEDAASLLPDQVRPALLWTIKVDKTGEGTDVRVERARVKSRAKLDYAGVQKQFDDGTIDPMLALLKEIGELRLSRERTRGGVSLPLPEQEVDVEGSHWSLSYRTQRPVEQWNAEISLLTGMGAASLMTKAKVGILRTLPPAEQHDLDRLRHIAKAVGVTWPKGTSYPDFIRSIDPNTPAGAAVLVAATRTLRGASYAAFNGELPAQSEHSALAGQYAHVTAPLRRLVDRYAGEICVALSAGEPVPQWVLDHLDDVPEIMRSSASKAGQYESAVLNLVEAAMLAEQVGSTFDGVVVSVTDKDPSHGSLMITSPSVEAPISSSSPLPLGQDVHAKLATADVATRKVAFELA